MEKIQDIITMIDHERETAKKYKAYRTIAIQKAENLIGELEALGVYVNTLWDGYKTVDDAKEIFYPEEERPRAV